MSLLELGLDLWSVCSWYQCPLALSSQADLNVRGKHGSRLSKRC